MDDQDNRKGGGSSQTLCSVDSILASLDKLESSYSAAWRSLDTTAKDAGTSTALSNLTFLEHLFCDSYYEHPTPLKDQCQWLVESVDCLQRLNDEVQIMLSTLVSLDEKRREAISHSDFLLNLCSDNFTAKKDLEELIASIESRLKYFKVYSNLSREIGESSLSFIAKLMTEESENNRKNYTKNRLLEIFHQIDEATIFFNLHQDFLESSSQSASLASVRDNLLLSIRVCFKEVLSKYENQSSRYLIDRSGVRKLDYNYLYIKGRNINKNLKGILIVVLERALYSQENRYETELDMIQSLFSAMRLRLVDDPLKFHLKNLIKKPLTPALPEDDFSEVPIRVRQAATLVYSIVDSEVKTFKTFFNIDDPSRSIDMLISNLSDNLLSLLRPLILHCNSICELREISECLRLESLIVEGSDAALDSLEISPKLDLCLAPFLSVLNRLQKDIQERIIFKSEQLVLTQIRGFEPTPDQLDYPLLLFKEPPPLGLYTVALDICDSRLLFPLASATMSFASSKAPPDKPQISNLPSEGDQLTFSVATPAPWFPPLETLSECLASTAHVLTRRSFETLAQHAVESTLDSLHEGAEKLFELKHSFLDSSLFLIRQLLVLRDQISAFNVELVSCETGFDFEAAKQRVLTFFSRTAAQKESEATTASFSLLPKIQYLRVDTKRSLELALKQHCELLVAHCSVAMMLPLLRLSSTIAETQRSTVSVAPDQASGRGRVPLKILDQCFTEFRTNLVEFFPRLRFNFEVYLTFDDEGDELAEVTWQPFPLSLVTEREEREPEAEEGTPLRRQSVDEESFQMTSPKALLLSAIQLSLIEGLRYTEEAILNSDFGDDQEEAVRLNPSDLAQRGWLPVILFSALFQQWLKCSGAK